MSFCGCDDIRLRLDSITFLILKLVQRQQQQRAGNLKTSEN